MKVVVTGATGLIGKHLIEALVGRRDSVVALSRRTTTVAGMRTTPWNAADQPMPAEASTDADVVVNLAGAGIGDGRWGAAHRRDILESRITVTRRVVDALGGAGPATLVNASAIGFYRPTDGSVDESGPAGRDFLASVCEQWEGEARKADGRARVVLVRTGVVLARDGGALRRMALPARFGLGGRLGAGTQVMSWVHIDDEVNAILHAIDNPSISGPVNIVAPGAVTQKEFASTLGRVLHRPAFLPTPGFVLRLALGGPAELALTGQRVVPSVLAASGFTFTFPLLAAALADLLRHSQPKGD